MSKNRQLPKAFTEKGLYMLATILKGPTAVKTTISIVETFAKLKELSRLMVKIPNEETNEQQKCLLKRSSQLIEEIFDGTMPKQSSETSVEFNFAMFKLKHSVKRSKE